MSTNPTTETTPTEPVMVNRNSRHYPGDWSRAARRAHREHVGIAEAVRQLVRAYADGTIDLP